MSEWQMAVFSAKNTFVDCRQEPGPELLGQGTNSSTPALRPARFENEDENLDPFQYFTFAKLTPNVEDYPHE
jgi:hypothetical protein